MDTANRAFWIIMTALKNAIITILSAETRSHSRNRGRSCEGGPKPWPYCKRYSARRAAPQSTSSAIVADWTKIRSTRFASGSCTSSAHLDRKSVIGLRPLATHVRDCSRTLEDLSERRSSQHSCPHRRAHAAHSSCIENYPPKSAHS